MANKEKVEEKVIERSQIRNSSAKVEKLLQGLTNDYEQMSKKFEKSKVDISEVRSILAGLTNAALSTPKEMPKVAPKTSSVKPPKLLTPAKPAQEKASSKPEKKVAQIVKPEKKVVEKTTSQPGEKPPLKEAVFNFLQKNGTSNRSVIHAGVQSMFQTTWSKQSLYKAIDTDPRLSTKGEGVDCTVSIKGSETVQTETKPAPAKPSKVVTQAVKAPQKTIKTKASSKVSEPSSEEDEINNFVNKVNKESSTQALA